MSRYSHTQRHFDGWTDFYFICANKDALDDKDVLFFAQYTYKVMMVIITVSYHHK